MEDVNLGNSHEPTVSSEVNELKKYHSQPEHTHSLPLSSNSSNTRKCYRCNGPRAHECLKNSIEGSFNKGKANINVVEYYAQTMVSQYTENFKEEMGQGTHSIQMREDDTQIPTFKCTFNSSKGRCYTDPLRFNSKEGRCYTGPSQFNSIRRCYTDLLDDKVQLSLSIGHDLQIMQSQIPQRIKELPKNSPFKDPDPCPCSENYEDMVRCLTWYQLKTGIRLIRSGGSRALTEADGVSKETVKRFVFDKVKYLCSHHGPKGVNCNFRIIISYNNDADMLKIVFTMLHHSHRPTDVSAIYDSTARAGNEYISL
uniref:Uncharacterized protein n=1 Tax=Bursaphelenchus xylophilus TaxID=6326 RepID=A0A1I7SI81_BURXY